MRPELEPFVAARTLAIVGVSRTKGSFGNYALKTLRERGYVAYPVNANTDEVEGEKCYRSLEALPEKVDAVITVVPPAQTVGVVEECARLGLGKVWLQQGSQSPEAVAACRKHALTFVSDACALMYLKPDGFHAVHGWLDKAFGGERRLDAHLCQAQSVRD